MQKLTPATLDALEAARKAATPGEWSVEDADVHGRRVLQKSERHRMFPIRGEDAVAIALAHNALPALIAAARATVPEVIGERHRDGNWWLVFDGERKRWVQAYWMQSWGFWRIAGGNSIKPDPTHALPIPPAPEGTDA